MEWDYVYGGSYIRVFGREILGRVFLLEYLRSPTRQRRLFLAFDFFGVDL
jgi:hypothetical protein